MVRATSLARRAVVLAAALAATGAAAAADTAANDGRRSNSFSLVYSVAAPHAPVVVPSQGTGIGPGKAVVRDPYKVPLMQNAGSLHFGR
jgi:hypothetical protein